MASSVIAPLVVLYSRQNHFIDTAELGSRT
jgi:hypothetical protein